ncbi:MAG: DUF3363 domain-containing protein, partial [Sphingomonadales bacterium]
DRHLDRVLAYEGRLAREQPVMIETLSSAALDQLPGANAATWLDRALAGEEPIVARDAGFGREVRAALAARRQWLIEQGLAQPVAGGIAFNRGALALLQRRELLRVAGELEGSLRKVFVESRQGEKIEGRLTRRIALMSGRYALVERSREFTLVPWRPVLERQFGNRVAGTVQSGGIDWQLGSRRRGPEISSI